MAEIEISIIIPAFNEERRLPMYLKQWLSFLPKHFSSFEIIIVDDGSQDNLEEAIHNFDGFGATVLYTKKAHEGKGTAVKYGMELARGLYRLFADADGATAVEETLKLLEKIKNNNYQVAIGSRIALEGSTIISRKLSRHYIGRIFATVTSIISGLSIYDTQCGFKMFTKEASQKIFSKLQTTGFAFDVELLMLARSLGFKVCEVPINWSDKEGSKVKIFRHSFSMLWDILKMRLRLR